MKPSERLQRLIDGWMAGESIQTIMQATGYSRASIYSTVSRLRRDGFDLPIRESGRPKVDRSTLRGPRRK